MVLLLSSLTNTLSSGRGSFRSSFTTEILQIAKNQALAHAVIFTIALGPGAARPPQGEISIAAVQPELVHPTPAAIQCEVMF